MKYVELKTQDAGEQAHMLSALHDGQLDVASAAALVRASLSDEGLMQQWRSMSAISAAMQSSVQVALGAAQTPVVAAMTAQPAANDSIFRWKMVAGFAALAAVGSVVWGLVGQQVPSGGAQLAQQSQPALSSAALPQGVITVQANASNSAELQVMIRDPRLDELLAAHKQFGGMSALQQPAGSLRSVSLMSTRP
ncbi:MAG: anti-anti-sigma factor [Brachymonas sp.]|nr:anti-anti-sigma factor [Brachymonas sp.]